MQLTPRIFESSCQLFRRRAVALDIGHWLLPGLAQDVRVVRVCFSRCSAAAEHGPDQGSPTLPRAWRAAHAGRCAADITPELCGTRATDPPFAGCDSAHTGLTLREPGDHHGGRTPPLATDPLDAFETHGAALARASRHGHSFRHGVHARPIRRAWQRPGDCAPRARLARALARCPLWQLNASNPCLSHDQHRLGAVRQHLGCD